MNDTERAMNDSMGYGIFIVIPLILWIIKCLIKFVLFIMFKPRWSTGILWLICGVGFYNQTQLSIYTIVSIIMGVILLVFPCMKITREMWITLAPISLAVLITFTLASEANHDLYYTDPYGETTYQEDPASIYSNYKEGCQQLPLFDQLN